MRKNGCLIALLVLGWLGYVLRPEPEEPLRTDVEPLQRRLALDCGICSAAWRVRPALEYAGNRLCRITITSLPV